jgi:hypothetical protein
LRTVSVEAGGLAMAALGKTISLCVFCLNNHRQNFLSTKCIINANETNVSVFSSSKHSEQILQYKKVLLD